MRRWRRRADKRASKRANDIDIDLRVQVPRVLLFLLICLNVAIKIFWTGVNENRYEESNITFLPP